MSRTLVIAEAGVNHNGDLAVARELVRAAAAAGADIVKFQTFRTSALTTARAARAPYQKRPGADRDDSQRSLLAGLELSFDGHRELVRECAAAGAAFLSTAFDEESAAFLSTLDLGYWKIPSGEITNVPFLRRVGASGKSVLLSTGMATLGEVDEALGVLLAAGAPRAGVTLLHCTTEYPAPFPSTNLLAMVTLRDAFKVAVGFSDHTQGIEMAVAAVALGASVIEKHFTLDRRLPGVDQAASLEPREFAGMVSAIRNVEAGLGDGIKAPGAAEVAMRVVARKSIVARRLIRSGEVLSEDCITVKRPGDGIPASRWDDALGRVAHRDFAPDEQIEW